MKTGVYFLFLKGLPVYVGQTTQWPKRIQGHCHTIDFDEAKIMEFKEEELREHELKFIQLLKPLHNVAGKEKVVNRKITREWVTENQVEIKTSIESKNTRGIIKRMKDELKYSPRCGSTDMLNTLINSYCKFLNFLVQS